MKIKLLTTTALLVGAISMASAGKFDQPAGSLLQSDQVFGGNSGTSSVPNSTVRLSFDSVVGESWDGADDVDNVFTTCLSGTAITGIEWENITLETVGGSWLSEAVFQFTDSSGSASAGTILNLTVGIADGAPGVGTYSSGGVVDLTDNGIPDVTSLADGNFMIQLLETFDDNADGIDSNFTSGVLRISGIDLQAIPAGPNCLFGQQPAAIIPATNNIALFALFLALMLFGRRFIKQK